MGGTLSLHGYLLLAALAILEGPLLAIACGVGAGLGFLDPFIAYGILVVGDFLPDLMYYWIGRYGATLAFVRRFASRTRLVREHFLPLEQLWRTRLISTLATAKLAYGFAPPLVVSAGLSGVPFGKFVRASLITGALYMGLLAAVGYGFARAYGYVDVATGKAPEVIGVTGFLCFCVLVGTVRYARRRLLAFHPDTESNLIDTEA